VLRHLVKEIPDSVGRPANAISSAATGGKLWFGAASGLALLGRRGRRAAVSALAGYGIASAAANGPAKWVAGRSRPRGVLLASLPRLGRRPSTSSFPSSHTAAAIAFATAASIELPAAAPAVFVPAAAIALARMRAVRHYPSDVLAGAALGVVLGGGSALLIRRLRTALGRGDVSETQDRVDVGLMADETGWDGRALGS
jgi:membrane-associated phospholipid phosphatase